MWELDYKEGWAPNWCFWIVVLGKTLESPLDSKEIKPVNPKENRSWIFTGRTDAEAEAQILWPPDAKNWLNGIDPGAGKDWRQEEMGTTEDEMVGWHQQLNGQEQAPQVGDGEGSLACCSSWGGKSWTWLSDWTEALYRKSLQTSDLNTWGPYPRDKTHQIHVSDFNIHTFFTLGKTFWYWLSVRFCKLERFRILNST